MKKTKMFLMAILLVTSTWLAKAQNGSSCGDAIELTLAEGDSLGMQSSREDAFWYFFKAEDNRQVWKFTTKNIYQRRLVDVIAYDDCEYTLSNTDQFTKINDSTILVSHINLTIDNNYSFKLVFETNTECETCIEGADGYYDIKYVSKAAAYTACTTTPCNTNPPSTTCEYVCNGGFEINNGAPGGMIEFERVCGWDNYYYTSNLYSGQCSSVGTTPDFYNTSGVPVVDIPCNGQGYENANTGSSYIGLVASGKSSSAANQGCWIEAVSTTLRYPLNNNKTYKLSYYISLSDRCDYNTNNNFGFSVINTGTAPSVTSYTFDTSTIPRVGWAQRSMTFTPTNSEDVLMIGATYTTTNRTSAPVSFSTCASASGDVNDTYYYIDDVSLVEVTNMSITASSTAGCSGETWTLTASGANTYTWLPGNSTATSITVAPTSSTVYTLTGTSASSVACYVPPVTVTISPYACCANGNSGNFTLRDVNLVAFGTGGATAWTSLTAGGYYTGNIAVPTGTIITNTLTIASSMTISTPVTFSLCNIAITEDDAITQNSLTYIRRSWLWGCDKLWEGIVSTAKLEVYDSFLEDAYIGIYGGNVTTYDGLICDNVVFNKNYYSIVAASCSVSPSNFNITGCIFTSRTISNALHDFTPPRYTTSLAPISGKVPAKIKASTTHSITTNTIRSNIGIYMAACISTSTVNISIGETSGTPTLNASYTNYFDYVNGGIYNLWSKIFVKNNSFTNISNTGVGNAIGAIVHDDWNFFSDPKITKTTVGYATGGSIYKNTFTAVKDGVVAMNSGTLEVSGNDFHTISRYGVSVSTWSSSSSPLEPVTVSANSYTDCLYPFYAYDNNYVKASVISNTVTHVASTYTSGYCAYINELSKPANATYSITSNKYSGMLNGIIFINTSGARIVGNTITIKKPGTGVFNAGITLSNTDNTIVSDNIIDCNATNSNSWYTFGVLGDASASNTVQCNTITKVGSCLKFQGSGSPTYIHDNSLNYNGSDPCLFGVLLDNGANIGSIGLYESSTWKRSNDIWGDFLYGGSNNGADTYVQGTNPNYSVGGTIHYDAGATAALYTPSVNLFAAGNTVFTPSNNTNSNGFSCGIGAKFAAPDSNGGGKNVGSDLNSGTKKRIIMRNGNSTSREIANENTFQAVDSLLMDYIATGNNGSLNSAKSANAGINASDNIEQNQKDFNGIYAVYLEDNRLVSKNQIQDLADMAKLCPFTNGLAVYQARGLMRRWDDSTFYYNPCEINVPTQEEHARNVTNALTGSNVLTEVYPNPSNGSLTVKSNITNCIFEVYDIVGKRVLSQKLNENETKIDVTSFNNGTYLYKITDNANKVIKNGKLVISH